VVPGFIVPQQVYRNETVFLPSPTVKFYVHGYLGIRLSDAIVQNFNGLAGTSEQVIMTQTAMKIAIRILVGSRRYIARRG
jgi:hypothetical protein